MHALFGFEHAALDTKWREAMEELALINLKYLVDFKEQKWLRSLFSLEQLLRAELNKINNFLNKKVESFPLYRLLSSAQLLKVVNEPLLFFRYHYPTVTDAFLEQSNEGTFVTLTTLYD
jgi:hypothetical protein